MRSFRSKPVGWRYESVRHSLAAKGIKTKRYLVANESEARMDLLALGVDDELLAREAEMKSMAIGRAQSSAGSLAEKMRLEEAKRNAFDESRDYADAARVLLSVAGKKKYMAEGDKYDKIASFLKSAADDGRAKVPDYHELHKERVMGRIFEQYQEEFGGAEVKGKLRPGATKSFMDDDLTNEMKDYKDGKIDEMMLRQNLARRAAKHKQQYSSTFTPWHEKGDAPAGSEKGSLMPDVLRETDAESVKEYEDDLDEYHHELNRGA